MIPAQLALFVVDEVEAALPARVLAMLADHGRQPGVTCIGCARFMISARTRRYICEIYGDDGTAKTEWHGYWDACGRWECKAND